MSPTEAKALANMLIEGLEGEHKITEKVVAAVPDAQLDFKLGDKGRTTRELAWHLIASEDWFADSIAKGDFSSPETPMPPKASVADMNKFYADVASKLAKLKTLSGEQLAQTVSFFGAMQLPNAMYLNFWNNHSVHHRGQLSVYLRAMNAHVPSIYGGSADEPFQMPTGA